MQAEQLTKLSNSFSLMFHLVYVWCCSILNVLILTLLCVNLFYSVRVTELPPVWERAANLAYHL